MKRDFKKSKEFFERALIIDPNHHEANYYLGLINLLGLGTEVNIEKA